MKKLLIIVVVSLFLAGCESVCELDGSSVCTDEETGAFLIEPDARLTVAVETEEYGEALAELWNRKYPEYQDAVSYVVYQDMDVEEYHKHPVDLPILWDAYAVSIESGFRELPESLVEEADARIADNFRLHTRYFKYLPLSAVGSVFATNLTLLEASGIDMSDANGDGLVDCLDSFEEISGLDMDVRMHLYLDDQYTAYFIGTNGFMPFADHDPYVPGFDSEAFLNAMNTTSDLADIVDESENFIYPDDLANADVPFLIALPTMMIDAEESVNEVDYSFSAYPSYKGQGFHPLANSKGYLISVNCMYPSAAAALLELIYSDEGLQLYLDNTDEYMVVDNMGDFDYHSSNREGISRAYLSSGVMDFGSYVGNENLVSGDLLDDIGYFEVCKKVFRHELAPEAARNLLVSDAEKWYQEHNLVTEDAAE